MRIISSSKMGPGTFEAKFIPLSLINSIEKIYILREERGPYIDKLEYIIFPKFIRKNKFFKFLIPFYLSKYSDKYKCDLILAYHIIPHAFYAFFASILSGIPFACAQTGHDIQKFSKKQLFRILLKKVYDRALFLNVPGKKTKDFCVDLNGNVKLIEINNRNNEINFYQMNNGPLFREYTEEIVRYCSKSKKNICFDFEV